MRVVVALGGNAIQPRGDKGTIAEQRAHLREAVEPIAALSAAGHEVVLTHGNGPQVGRLLLQDEALPDQMPRFPLDVHVAETQGQLGYLIQQELASALARVGVARPVVTVVTQTLVDEADPAFAVPTKPIGPFLSAKGAAEYRARGIPVTEVAGGGWRRVVASPEPIDVIEAPTVCAVLTTGAVPITCGGGGIPVVRDGSGTRGVAAVVDKDLAAAVLTRATGADALLILTDVEQVVAGYGTPNARALERLSVADARAGVESGAFPRGSMGEKVLAASRVADAGGLAVIASLQDAARALDGRAGTRVVRG